MRGFFGMRTTLVMALLASTTMAQAVSRAMSEAEAGDTVLLAPAAASFDQYDSFERRGEDFVAQVMARLSTQIWCGKVGLDPPPSRRAAEGGSRPTLPDRNRAAGGMAR